MNAKTYVKKPIRIKALQWTGLNPKEMIEFGGVDSNGTSNLTIVENSSYSPNSKAEEQYRLKIETLEGTMWASIGDYIIKGVRGEFYPCRGDIFEETYVEVDE